MNNLLRLKSLTLILPFLTIFNCLEAFSQEDSALYTSAFRFETGIYLSYEEFKNNDPAIKKSPVKTENIGSQMLFGTIFQNERIAYTDSLGKTKKVASGKVWGYCHNGSVYVRQEQLFNRLTKIGAITHFARSENSNLNRDDTRLTKRGIFNNQFILHFPTGKIYNYELRKFMAMISNDKELSQEFMNLKNDKMRKIKMFIFLNRYNERNPIYFPVSKVEMEE